MKIAVTYENGNVFPHFGHTEQFKVYEIEDGKVAGAQVVDTNGSGHGALAGMLSALNGGAALKTARSITPITIRFMRDSVKKYSAFFKGIWKTASGKRWRFGRNSV